MKYVLVLDDEWIKKTDDGTPYVTLALRDDLTIKLIVDPMIEQTGDKDNGRDTTG